MLVVRIEGTELPGRSCAPADAPMAYENVHVGVQRAKEVLDLVRGDAKTASWEFELTTKDDGVDVGGPFVHGKKGERFFYLSWGSVDSKSKAFMMFRRAKLMLADIPEKILRAAIASEGKTTLVGEISLTDARGLPICARVKPPKITWRAVPRRA